MATYIRLEGILMRRGDKCHVDVVVRIINTKNTEVHLLHTLIFYVSIIFYQTSSD